VAEFDRLVAADYGPERLIDAASPTTMHPDNQLTDPIHHPWRRGMFALSFGKPLVAGIGFEPYDLQVMR